MSKDYVIITGAYGGLGKALSLVYAEEGFGIILLGRNKTKLQDLENKLADITEVKSIICDISNWESCKNAHTQITALNLRIKILINNAGITYIQNFNKDYKIAKYRELIDTNLNGAVYMSQLFIENLTQNKGSIITISSVIGYAPVIGRTAYAASKFGLEGFFSVLKAEQNNRLHIMMVYPTFIQTQIRAVVKGDKTINEVLTPQEVADKIIKAYTEKKSKIYIGKTAKLSYYLYKYFPNFYVNLMRKKVADEI